MRIQSTNVLIKDRELFAVAIPIHVSIFRPIGLWFRARSTQATLGCPALCLSPEILVRGSTTPTPYSLSNWHRHPNFR